MPANRVVLAEYFTTDESIYLFIVRNDFEEPEVFEISLNPEEVRRFIFTNFHAEQRAREDPPINARERIQELDEDAFHTLFAPLVEPLIAASPRGDQVSSKGDIIWFVPHGVLHYLPMHALRVEGSYLIDRNPVCYAPSASVMKFCHKKRRGRREKALILADSRNDLVHARGEAMIVGEMFGATPYLNALASKSLFLEKIEGERDSLDVLHFSCHGYFDNTDALKSGIMLAPEGGSNAVDSKEWNLTAEEIFRLELKADLVTLSACESGINEQKPGDELIGLTRALIFAGTPSVIVSMWAVDDLSTSLLVQRFYQNLRPASPPETTLNKAEALREAQQFVKGMTARQVVDYVRQQLTAPRQSHDAALQARLQIDMANAQVVAGDLKAAITSYQDIQTQGDGLSPELSAQLSQQVSETLSLLQFRSEEMDSPMINYDEQPFAHSYYWAPFILVGDWR
jgi:CHAT domain-containing protein